ncbi:MAG TPA: hypothetical protein VLB76_02540 [Thermoanaerobaculia bacterium]|nr:hypothetical protein [Thermoanaerobaculia bacterium]
MKRRRRTGEVRPWWIFFGIALFAILLSLHVVNELVRSRHAEALASGPTPPITTEVDGVRLRGWADRSKVRPGDSFDLWIVIENRSGTNIASLGFREFRHPGFVEVGACWRDRRPVCRPGDAAAKGLPDRLENNQVTSLGAQLRPAGGAGDWVVTGLTEWTKAGGGQAQGAVFIGPIQVSEPSPSGWLSSSEAVYTFFKDLGLSIVLALLAYAFQRLQQERSRAQDTYNLFLTKATDNAIQYFLPIIGGANGLREQVRKLRAGADPAEPLSRGFYYALYFIKRMRELTLKGGAFLLPDLYGEQLIQHCWIVFYGQAVQYLGYREISRVLDILEPQETLTSFEEKLRPHGLIGGGKIPPAVIAQMRTGFASWVTGPDFANIKIELSFLAVVLQYETNRLYGPWYREEDRRSRTDLEQLATDLSSRLPPEQASALIAYLAGLPPSQK